MDWLLGCFVAALAGAGMISVPHSMFYEYPALFFP